MLLFTRDFDWRTSHEKMETVLDILSLKHNGLSQRTIARKLGTSRTTVKNTLQTQGWRL